MSNWEDFIDLGKQKKEIKGKIEELEQRLRKFQDNDIICCEKFSKDHYCEKYDCPIRHKNEDYIRALQRLKKIKELRKKLLLDMLLLRRK